MDNNLHELVFVLNHSSELDNRYDDVKKSFKALLDAQKNAKANTNVTINVFGSDYTTVCDGISIKDVKLSDDLFPLSSVCSLNDSAVKAIDDVGVRLTRTYESCRPSKVITVIVTFGRDNASKKHTYNDLAEVIRHQTEVYKWSFFLMTDFSINMEKLNIPEDNTVIIKKNEADGIKKAYDELIEKIAALRNGAASENDPQQAL
ncbi:MAG: hypothetical protein NC394_02045 [Bacteroides sp.]|nr:hypothetical protein [Bacteroides sp.]